MFPRYFPDGAYPPNTLLIISRLVKPEFLVEIEAMAVKPPTARAATRAPSGRAARPSPASGRARKRRR